tara:strand:+ start:618 stop:842 length:225 start_codon:yes stop_codon:yes gene_type:complete
MDTLRWKSILVPREVYEEIRAISSIENRSIGGQLRTIFDFWKSEILSEEDKVYVKARIEKLQKQYNQQASETSK